MPQSRYHSPISGPPPCRAALCQDTGLESDGRPGLRDEPATHCHAFSAHPEDSASRHRDPAAEISDFTESFVSSSRVQPLLARCV